MAGRPGVWCCPKEKALFCVIWFISCALNPEVSSASNPSRRTKGFPSSTEEAASSTGPGHVNHVQNVIYDLEANNSGQIFSGSHKLVGVPAASSTGPGHFNNVQNVSHELDAENSGQIRSGSRRVEEVSMDSNTDFELDDRGAPPKPNVDQPPPKPNVHRAPPKPNVHRAPPKSTVHPPPPKQKP